MARGRDLKARAAHGRGEGVGWYKMRPRSQPELEVIIELILPDMTCGHCVRTVTAAVKQVDVQAEVQVDLPAHRVRIESAQHAENFVRALADEGYPAAR